MGKKKKLKKNPFFKSLYFALGSQLYRMDAWNNLQIGCTAGVQSYQQK